MEAVLLLASVTRRFRVQLDPDRMPGLFPTITLRPREGARARVALRAARPAPDAERPPRREPGRPRPREVEGRQTFVTFSAAGPFWPCTTSNSTFCPSLRLL